MKHGTEKYGIARRQMLGTGGSTRLRRWMRVAVQSSRPDRPTGRSPSAFRRPSRAQADSRGPCHQSDDGIPLAVVLGRNSVDDGCVRRRIDPSRCRGDKDRKERELDEELSGHRRLRGRGAAALVRTA